MISLDEVRARLPEYFRLRGVTVRHPANHHLVVPVPTAEQVHRILNLPGGKARLEEGIERRETLLKLMEADPLLYGYVPEEWQDVDGWLGPGREVLLMGGNRSGKTEFAARYSVKDMVDGVGRIWGFLHSSEESSIRLQHPRVYKYLPPQWRDLKSGAGSAGPEVYVQYKEVSGFANRTIILPNGSRGFFFNYKQDPSVLEGYEFDGVWADELIPRSFEEAVRYRLVTRRGRLIETFTPVEGYSLTVSGWLAGAWVVRSKASPLLPGRNVAGCPEGQMPYELQCMNSGRKVFFFFTASTPYGDPDNDMAAKLEGATTTEIKLRAYGWPEKLVGNAFPLFSRLTHVIKRNERHTWNGRGLVPPSPWLAGAGGEALYPRLGREGTNYCVMDPGVSKNHVIKWYRVTPQGWVMVYREWPPMSTHGEWAVPGDKADGKPGPAQRFDFGMGTIGYKQLILEAQGWVWTEERGWDGSGAERIEDYFIDPRGGGVEVPSAEDPSSLIEQFDREDVDDRGRVVGPGLTFLAAPGSRVLEGLTLLVDRFAYDTSKPVSLNNCPGWYVVDACEQSIYAYEEYTGADGEKGALKDIIDPDRYFVNAGCGYVGARDLEIRNPNLEEDYGD